MNFVCPGCFEVQAQKQQELHELKMIWAELVLIQEALCWSVCQVLGDDTTKTLLVQCHGFLIRRIISKIYLEMAFVLPWFTSDVSHKFFFLLQLRYLSPGYRQATISFGNICLVFYLFTLGTSVCLYAGHPKGTAFTVILLWSSRRPYPSGVPGFELGLCHPCVIVIGRRCAPGCLPASVG